MDINILLIKQYPLLEHCTGDVQVVPPHAVGQQISSEEQLLLVFGPHMLAQMPVVLSSSVGHVGVSTSFSTGKHKEK